MDKSKNVFISHHGKDDEHIGKLKDLLAKRGYSLKNSSIDSSKRNGLTNENAIKRLLRMRINWAGTFLCLIGKETHTREWVDWEIKKAAQQGKKIVGIYLYGEKDSATIPQALEDYGSTVRAWNTDSIIDAIENTNNIWSNPDGNSRNPKIDLIRAEC